MDVGTRGRGHAAAAPARGRPTAYSGNAANAARLFLHYVVSPSPAPANFTTTITITTSITITITVTITITITITININITITTALVIDWDL